MSFNQEKFKEGLIAYSEEFLQKLIWLQDMEKRKEEFEKQLSWRIKEYMRQIYNLAKQCAKEGVPTKPKQPKELTYWEADTAKTFIKFHLRFALGCIVTKDKVYNAYVAYCDKERGEGIHQSKNVFSKILLRLIPKIQTAKIRIDGKAKYCWRDLEYYE